MIETTTAEQFTEIAQAIETQVGKMIVGQRDIVRQTLITLLAGGNALLEGVPGLGKTMLVRTLAQVLDCKFSRVQFTPDLMPADIVGTNNPVLVPYDQVYQKYAEIAGQTMERSYIPSGLQDFVKEYFSGLEP